MCLGNLMGAEEVGVPEGGEEGKEGFGGADFFLKIFKSVREGVADRKS